MKLLYRLKRQSGLVANRILEADDLHVALPPVDSGHVLRRNEYELLVAAFLGMFNLALSVRDINARSVNSQAKQQPADG